MEIGMLWFDDGKNSIQEKVSQAVTFYQGKFGETPTHCLVHPSTLGGNPEGVVSGVRVRKARTVMPNHYWIGVEATTKKSSTRKIVKQGEPAIQEIAA
ncbi:MAG: hypothetical protein MUP44_13600 [Anaerolineales bacterium]|nr:hypothetical protein [Anaerolineales bacterium]